ncbi:MAG: hypothetical protein KIPDCIKN_02816 [Haliscomenobacter sp.]|jgi:hypothetical protein|nr:hypothetical protein [Haliscomenobacter sp.]
MTKENKLDHIRDLIANGKIDKAFDELKNLSKGIDDRQLRNSIILNCYSYNKNYNEELLNLKNDTTGVNRAILKTLEFIDEIEERISENKEDKGYSAKGDYQLICGEELPIEIEKKIDAILEKYFGDKIIDRGDLYKSLSRTAISMEQLDKAVYEVKKHFDFFQKEFAYSSGMTLSNFITYAIDAIFIPEEKWTGSRNRNKTTREFRELIKKGK